MYIWYVATSLHFHIMGYVLPIMSQLPQNCQLYMHACGSHRCAHGLPGTLPEVVKENAVDHAFSQQLGEVVFTRVGNMPYLPPCTGAHACPVVNALLMQIFGAYVMH